MSEFAAELDADGTTTVVALTGEIDIDNAPDLKSLGLMAVTASHVAVVEFEMSEVTFIDSSGIAALIEIHNAAETLDVRVRIKAASAPVARVFILSGLAEMFGIIGR